jgi:hypothetical protein
MPDKSRTGLSSKYFARRRVKVRDAVEGVARNADIVVGAARWLDALQKYEQWLRKKELNALAEGR